MKTIQVEKNNGCVLSQSKGQVMMIVVMVLSGVIIGSVAISGIMTARQTRQTADAGASAKAVYAADAGLEWRVYKFIKDYYNCECPSGKTCDELLPPQFEDSNVVLNTNCSVSSHKPDEVYSYYTITSNSKVSNSSYVFKQEIRVIK